MFLPSDSADPSVEAAVRAFAAAADARDLAALDAALHPDFRVLLTRPGAAGVTVLPRAAYTQMARDGKVGGTARAVVVHAAATRGDLAWASVTLTGAAARFESLLTLARHDGAWRVVEDATRFTPVA